MSTTSKTYSASKFFDKSALSSNEFTTRLVATSVVAIAGAVLYNNVRRDFNRRHIKSPSWFIKNKTVHIVAWVIFFILFALAWYTVSVSCADPMMCNMLNLVFVGVLVAVFIWLIGLFGVDDSLERRLKNSRYFILGAAVLMLVGALYCMKYDKMSGGVALLLAVWLFYSAAGLFQSCTRDGDCDDSDSECDYSKSHRSGKRSRRSRSRSRSRKSESKDEHKDSSCDESDHSRHSSPERRHH